jgi:exonuclease SbcC
MENFYITSIYIENFRGYQKLDKPFIFSEDNKSLKIVLLSGANGYGKTSLLDAIEWCFTGTVERLEREFKSRCKNKEVTTEKANKGILRNRDGEGNPVYVKIEALYKENSIIIDRKFDGNLDIAGYNLSLPNVECKDDSIKKEFISSLKKIIDKFNDNYVCSYEKNIELYNKGRKDIYDMFSCFYRDNREAKNILSNFEEVKKRLEKKEEDVKKSLETIRKNKINSLKIAENVQSIMIKDIEKESYPNNMIYKDENIYPYSYLNTDSKNDKLKTDNEINNQISILTKVSLNVLYNILCKYKQYLGKSIKLNDFNNLKLEYENNLKIINILSKVDVYSLEQNRLSIEQKIKVLDTINSYSKLENNYINGNLGELLSEKEKTGLIEKISKIKDSIVEITKLNERINFYSTTNPISKVLRLIVDNIDGFKIYRDSNDKCPLCGNKEEFLQSELGLTAKTYLGEQDIERQNITKEINNIKSSNEILIKEVVQYIKSIYDSKLSNVLNLIEFRKKVNSFLNLCKKYTIDYKLITSNFIEENIIELSTNIKSFNFNEQKEDEFLNLLNSYNNGVSLVDLKNTLKKVNFKDLPINDKHNLISTTLLNMESEITNIDNLLLVEPEKLNMKDLDKRINIYKYVKYSIELNNVNNGISNIEKEETKFTEEHNNLIREIEKVSKIIKAIEAVLKNTEMNQVERIAEPLDAIYRKITRNTNIKRIKFERANTRAGNAELKVIDLNNNESPFANILSAGQLSTLAISIFLSKAMLNKNDSIRCYFMDEPIQTMDDLNILSFIDLLRFQLGEKTDKNIFIDQVFIATCDNDLEKLILHKMKSFGIGICEYKFEGPGKFNRSVFV